MGDDIVTRLHRHAHTVGHHRPCMVCDAAAEIIHLRAELVAVRAERDYWQREASR